MDIVINMTSYKEECLALIPGDTSKEKYEWVKKRIEELDVALKVHTEIRDDSILQVFNKFITGKYNIFK